MSSERHLLRAAVYLIVEKNDHILFIRRFQTGYRDGEYTLPAGHVEANETFLETCVREAKEEIGIEIDEVDLNLVHVMQRYENNVNVVDYYFSVKHWQGEVYIGEPHKADDLVWINKADLADGVIPFVREALTLTYSQVLYSHDGITKPSVD